MSSSLTRITGMYSGFDTDQLIKDLMKAESVKVDKVKQDKIYAEWQQEAYRDIINDIRGFKDEYFSYTNVDKNFRSSSAFLAYESTVQINGVDSSSYVSVSAGTGAQSGNHTINEITLGKKSIWESGSGVSDNMTGASAPDLTLLKNGDTFDLTLDGITKTITLNKDYDSLSLNDLTTDLGNQINAAFGAGKITVTDDGGNIKFSAASHSLKITNTNDGDTTVSELGFTSGDQNILDIGQTLQDANFKNSVSGTVDFTINGVDFTFNAAEDKVSDVINEINSSDAGVTLSYSSLSDEFTLQSDSEGVANNISFSDISGSFLGTTLGLAKVQDATDTQFTLDGILTTRSSNTFTLDGLEYTLKSNYSAVDNIDISINSSPDELVDKIKGFVDKYNELIGKINTELTEKKYYDYDPLTDEQKKGLTEDEVKQWEEKAKSGLLKRDSTLESMLRNMRSVLYDSVDGLALYDIGITTSSDYKDKGKLIIDEEKLKKAIQDNPNQVSNLFSKEDEGLAHRLYDIIEDNISTSTDSYGRKGLLLEKAGIEGDRTAKDNLLSDKIKRYEDTIVDLLEDLNDKENYYYTMFAKMERALAEMNSQSSFFTGQMG